jgi:ligand-binding sensor domain-containing protein
MGRLHLRAGALLASILYAAGSTLALDPALHIDQYGHDVWTSQNGLPGEAVYQILHSPEGYLWLRTSAGLVRFDGVRFVRVEPVVAGRTSHRTGEGDVPGRRRRPPGALHLSHPHLPQRNLLRLPASRPAGPMATLGSFLNPGRARSSWAPTISSMPYRTMACCG